METVTTKTWTRETGLIEKRDVRAALKRGFRGRCPRCGEGKLFRAFLKVADNCSVCELDFSPHRADDLPAYLVIIIVGHLVVPTALWIETNYSPPVWLHLLLWTPLILGGAILMLRPLKAGLIALQYKHNLLHHPPSA